MYRMQPYKNNVSPKDMYRMHLEYYCCLFILLFLTLPWQIYKLIATYMYMFVQWNLSSKDLWIKDISLVRRTLLPAVPVTQRNFLLNNLWNQYASLIRTLHVAPRVSVIERFHCSSLSLTALKIYIILNQLPCKYNHKVNWHLSLSPSSLSSPLLFLKPCSDIHTSCLATNVSLAHSSGEEWCRFRHISIWVLAVPPGKSHIYCEQIWQ